MQERRTH